jgi:hypothetical protein
VCSQTERLGARVQVAQYESGDSKNIFVIVEGSARESGGFIAYEMDVKMRGIFAEAMNLPDCLRELDLSGLHQVLNLQVIAHTERVLYGGLKRWAQTIF